MRVDWRSQTSVFPQDQALWGKRLVLIFHIRFSAHLQPFHKALAQIQAVLFLEVVEYLNRNKNTKLIFFFVIVDIIPEFVGNGKVLLFHLHAGLDSFSSLDCLLNDLMDNIQVDSCLSNQVVIPNQVSIPDLNSKNIRIHIFRFRRIKDWEFKTIVETSYSSTSPMSISFLRFWSSNDSSNKDIIGFHLNIFKHTVISFPDNDPQLILIERRRMNFMCRGIDPFLLFNQINPSLQSPLSSNSKLRIKISELNRLLFIKMPLFSEIS